MISIEITLNSRKELLKVSSRGHAPRLKSEQATEFNGLCTAISTLEYQLYYSLKQLQPNLNFDCKIESGWFEWNLVDLPAEKLDVTTFSAYPTISQSFVIGIKMIEAKYPKEISLKIKSI